jgi:hypothetical protein
MRLQKIYFLQAVLSFKLKVLSKIKDLQGQILALHFICRLMAVTSVKAETGGPYV